MIALLEKYGILAVLLIIGLFGIFIERGKRKNGRKK